VIFLIFEIPFLICGCRFLFASLGAFAPWQEQSYSLQKLPIRFSEHLTLRARLLIS
jgi:hypothetical protein